MSEDRDRREPGAAKAAADFVTSLGHFTLGMGLFSARQATRLLSAAGAQATASLDRATTAAGDRLSDVAEKARGAGANLERGLLDAAFDASGLGPRGQAPDGDTSGLAMPMTTAASRRVAGVRTVASGTLDRPVSQQEFIRRLVGHRHDAASGGPQPQRTVDGLWKCEGLATTVAKHLLPENSLNDPALPPRVLPVVHVGFGSGSAELHFFDAAKLDAVFAARCSPEYRLFAYEGIGAILRAYEPGFFKFLVALGGLMPLDAPEGPNAANFFGEFLDRFPPDVQRLISHGYGRLLAFSNLDIYRTIREATALPANRVEPVVHGAAFAFAMMNRIDLPRVLEHSAVPVEPPVRAAFQNGLVYALAFMEWYTPGVLAAWQPARDLEAELVGHACRESALAGARGVPLAFRLAVPRE